MKYIQLRALLKQVKVYPDGIELKCKGLVVDGKKFIDSHIAVLDYNLKMKKENKVVNNVLIQAYFDRLLFYYKKIKQK